mmetsp:Transcript_18703/g.21499  ORF Transcript_18703/g.21499 Transcript_18703/m.21499 type:complete len:166 (+) Transcript_18703:29-526(+)
MASKERVIQILEEGHKPFTCPELLEKLELTETDSESLMKLLQEMAADGSISLLNLEEKNSQNNYYLVTYEKLDKPAEKGAVTDPYVSFSDAELFKMQSDLIFKLNALKRERLTYSNEGQKKQKIMKLHLYNDLKDVCQLVLGKLSEIEKKTIAELHEELNIDLNE